MATTAPIIDPRNFDAILEEARRLAPAYTPEWAAREESGAGAALLKIFAKMLEGIIRRLNDVPLKNFIAFLEMIGIKLLPALPARAPLSFLLSTGAKEAVRIAARSQAAASPTGEPEPVVFETERTILATPAKLLAVLSLVPASDEVLDHTAQLQEKTVAELFTDGRQNKQEHSLYLGHDDLFNIMSPARIELSMGADGAALVHGKGVEWQYCVGEKKELVEGKSVTSLDWRTFAAAVFANGLTVLKKESFDQLKPVKVNGVKSRWIRCRVESDLSKLSPLARLTLGRITVNALPQGSTTTGTTTTSSPSVGVDPDAAFFNDLPLIVPPSSTRALYPFGRAPQAGEIGTRPRQGDIFYLASAEAFSKKGALITISVNAVLKGLGGIDVERVLGIGEVYGRLLKAAGIRNTTQLLRLSVEETAQIIGDTGPGSTRATTLDIREKAAKAVYDRVVTHGEEGSVDPNRKRPELSWEYWNGNGWVAIEGLQDGTGALTGQGILIFTCPADIAATTVVGQENYWIRVRIAFGDYGQEKFTVIDNTQSLSSPPAAEELSNQPFRVVIDNSAILPPMLTMLKIGYSVEGARPTYVQTLNNLQFDSPTDKFSPFVPLEDDAQALYLGFDRPPLKGPISIFFSLAEQEYAEEERPRVEWAYLREREAVGQWARLIITDGTMNLTESGTVEFIGPEDFAAVPRFGQTLYWIRATDVESLFRPAPPEGSEASAPPAPQVKGIYLNTVWATQAETIQGEIVGSSSGGAAQSFVLTKSRVIEESVWINEFGTLTETERKQMAAGSDLEVELTRDTEGRVTEFYIRWSPLDDLSEAGPHARVYSIDRTSGQIQFGDGEHGMIPPIGKDNIKATYQAGGGSRGNVAATLINTLRTTIPFVEKVTNPEAAGGGSDTEPLEKALVRGPQVLKHRRRAITAEDFEWLAREASQAVARVKCLPTFNDEGSFGTDWVTVIIVPGSGDSRPTPSPQLRARVEKYLRERSPNVASYPKQVKVIGPAYVEVAISAELFPLTIDLSPQVEAAAIARLERFLHPLAGGYGGSGWEFGRLPCLSDFYALLEAVEGVDHVEKLTMTLRQITPGGSYTGPARLFEEERPPDLSVPSYTLVFSGEHKITVKPLG
ncbi:MAG TPA: putative baseplate assembly protein [Pyrinomonadaceae bacterium]